MLLKHFMTYNPPNLHLWKSLTIISVQITTHSLCYSLSHAQAAPPAVPSEFIECYSRARRITKNSWCIPTGFKEAPKHWNECDCLSSAKIPFPSQTNAKYNLSFFSFRTRDTQSSWKAQVIGNKTLRHLSMKHSSNSDQISLKWKSLPCDDCSMKADVPRHPDHRNCHHSGG